jgi:hypothetical protein
MFILTYNPCLLVINRNAHAFRLISMQTNNTLMLSTAKFSSLKEKKLKKAQFRLKLKTVLLLDVQLDFNSYTLTIEKGKAILDLKQKGQEGKIKLVDIKAHDRAQQYIEQRARGAYIALTCQLEASFDLSVAAQAQQPLDEDIKALNKRLK